MNSIQPSSNPSNTIESLEDAQEINKKRIFICDRCGAEMREKLCKISCPHCGNRFDCSDLNIYFD